jgi:hypothetical protein
MRDRGPSQKVTTMERGDIIIEPEPGVDLPRS